MHKPNLENVGVKGMPARDGFKVRRWGSAGVRYHLIGTALLYRSLAAVSRTTRREAPSDNRMLAAEARGMRRKALLF